MSTPQPLPPRPTADLAALPAPSIRLTAIHHRRMHRRLRLEVDLRQAIETDRITSVYQPIVDVRTGAVASFEALARWDHPDLGPIPPDEFVPIAEETGLIVPLSQTILCRALDLLTRLNRQPHGRHVRRRDVSGAPTPGSPGGRHHAP